MHPAHAADVFFQFVRNYQQPGDIRNAQLSQLTFAWIVQGNAIEATEGNFDVLTQTMLIAAHRIQQDPSLLDYHAIVDGRPVVIPRQMTCILNPEMYTEHLDSLRETYNAWRDDRR